jgi:hypothetical protein
MNAANAGQPVGCGDCVTVWLGEVTRPAPPAGKAEAGWHPRGDDWRGGPGSVGEVMSGGR